MAAVGSGTRGNLPHLLNRLRPELAANVICWGGLRPADDIVATLTAPTLGIFFEADPALPRRDVYALRAQLEAQRKSYEIHLLPGAPNDWALHTQLGGEPVDADGWGLVLDFLSRVFAGDFPPSRVRWRWIPHGASASRDRGRPA